MKRNFVAVAVMVGIVLVAYGLIEFIDSIPEWIRSIILDNAVRGIALVACCLIVWPLCKSIADDLISKWEKR